MVFVRANQPDEVKRMEQEFRPPDGARLKVKNFQCPIYAWSTARNRPAFISRFLLYAGMVKGWERE
jgi:hypothetical protein